MKPEQIKFVGISHFHADHTGQLDAVPGATLLIGAREWEQITAAKPMAATRPDTDEAIAMFIEDERALWRIARKAKSISIEFPVKAGGTRTAAFETGGLAGTRLPGWD